MDKKLFGRFVISKSKTNKKGFFTEEVVYKYLWSGKVRSATAHERIVLI